MGMPNNSTGGAGRTAVAPSPFARPAQPAVQPTVNVGIDGMLPPGAMPIAPPALSGAPVPAPVGIAPPPSIRGALTGAMGGPPPGAVPIQPSALGVPSLGVPRAMSPASGLPRGVMPTNPAAAPQVIKANPLHPARIAAALRGAGRY